jgi:hypothetical protein
LLKVSIRQVVHAANLSSEQQNKTKPGCVPGFVLFTIEVYLYAFCGINASIALLFSIEAPIWSIIYHRSYPSLAYFSKLSNYNYGGA